MSKKLLLIIIIGVVVLGGGGATAFFLLTGGDEAAEEEAAAAAEEGPDEPGGLVSLDTFLANLNHPGGDRYVKLTLRLTVAPESLAQQLDQDDLMRARMRDRVLTILTAKTYDEIGNPMGKEALRQAIRAQLNPLLGGEGRIQEVLFSEFVVQ